MIKLLTKPDIDFFTRNGYVVVEKFLDPAALAGLRAECSLLASSLLPDCLTRGMGCIIGITPKTPDRLRVSRRQIEKARETWRASRCYITREGEKGVR